MKRTIFVIAAAGSALTAFLFFQPVSNNGGGLMSPATTASPVASASEQPVAFTSTDPSPQSMSTSKATSKPAPVINSVVTRKVTTNSPNISNPPTIRSIKGGGGDDEGDDEEDDD